jgi:hypothetical protein
VDLLEEMLILSLKPKKKKKKKEQKEKMKGTLTGQEKERRHYGYLRTKF